MPRAHTLSRSLLAAVIILFTLPHEPARAQDLVSFSRYQTEHYELFTNLTRAEAEPIGRHMDAVYDAYTRRFERAGIARVRHGRMPLYLLRTEADYLQFLKSAGMNAANTSGLFFIQPKIRGLATYTQGRSLTDTYSVLQHEGFHQFAVAHFRSPLPIWVNEGLAEYFEDAIVLKDSMKVDIVNGRRVVALKAAIRAGKSIPIEELLSIRDTQWQRDIRENPQTAKLLYDQSWSLVHFLINLPRDQGGALFEQYLRDLAGGTSHQAAWAKAFSRVSNERMQASWRQYVLKLQADPIHNALSSMDFLAAAMRYMHERDQTIPRTLGELRRRMQAAGFASTQREHGYTVRISAHDESLYQYTTTGHVNRPFVLLEPSREDLPPRITAPGLTPEPTLIWLRDAKGGLTTVIEYR